MDSNIRPDLVFEELDWQNPAELEAWHDVYKAAFPHPGEQEPREAFERILAMNEDSEIQRQFGPYREFIIALREPETREIVGGLNMGATTSDAHRKAGFAASAQVMFYFIDRRYRGRVTRGQVMDQVRSHALSICSPEERGSEIAIFFEANNPEKMSFEDILSDTEHSGLDTYRRYAGWLAVASPLDFDYVQPALDPSKEPVKFLDLFYKGKGKQIASKVILKHLYCFTSISVLKGRDAGTDPDFARMASDLDKRTSVGFIPRDSEMLARIRQEAKNHLEQTRRGTPPPPPIPEGSRDLSFGRRVADRVLAVGNLLYRFGYWLHAWLERFHLVVAYIELAFGAFGVALLSFDFFSNYNFDERDYEIPLLLFLLLYVGTQGLVSIRRSRLGMRANKLWRELRRNISETPDAADTPHDWLTRESAGRLKLIRSYGAILGAEIPEQERERRLRWFCGYSSTAYSDRRWGIVDPAWKAQEIDHFSRLFRDFPEGLWAAKFDRCPDRLFCNAVVPVIPQGRTLHLDLDNLEIDGQAARALMTGACRRSGYNPERGVYLLILRELVVGPLRGQPRSSKLEIQFGSVLTVLLQLGVFLEKLSRNGDLMNGLPKNCMLLCTAISQTNAELLEWLGFRLLQRPPTHLGVGPDENLGRANMSLYALTLDGPQEKAQQLRALLVEVMRQRYSPKLADM